MARLEKLILVISVLTLASVLRLTATLTGDSSSSVTTLSPVDESTGLSIRIDSPSSGELTESLWATRIRSDDKKQHTDDKDIQELKEKKTVGHDSEKVCTICLDFISSEKDKEIDRIKLDACNHEFHVKCIQNHMNKKKVYSDKCPNCRVKMAESEITTVRILGIEYNIWPKKNIRPSVMAPSETSRNVQSNIPTDTPARRNVGLDASSSAQARAPTRRDTQSDASSSSQARAPTRRDTQSNESSSSQARAPTRRNTQSDASSIARARVSTIGEVQPDAGSSSQARVSSSVIVTGIEIDMPPEWEVQPIRPPATIEELLSNASSSVREREPTTIRVDGMKIKLPSEWKARRNMQPATIESVQSHASSSDQSRATTNGIIVINIPPEWQVQPSRQSTVIRNVQSDASSSVRTGNIEINISPEWEFQPNSPPAVSGDVQLDASSRAHETAPTTVRVTGIEINTPPAWQVQPTVSTQARMPKVIRVSGMEIDLPPEWQIQPNRPPAGSSNVQFYAGTRVLERAVTTVRVGGVGINTPEFEVRPYRPPAVIRLFQTTHIPTDFHQSLDRLPVPITTPPSTTQSPVESLFQEYDLRSTTHRPPPPPMSTNPI